ncbi:MAG: ImmA/IrrE family metallo-endopeptidase, partial [Chloroflexi bacterium]|nr:ImmA/IrrE family metallo-endopeptidase [Chloroflexota bacterium]
PSENKVFLDIRAELSIAPATLAREVRSYLGIDLTQQAYWNDNNEALKTWRDVVQDKGVFIFKRSIKDRGISGFSLIHNDFPIIYLNNSTADTRQIFTVFHELAHILLHTSGVTKQDDSYIDVLNGESKDVELFCNQFAAEFLVPSRDFEQHLFPPYNDEFVEVLANRYKVSREVILRRLLDQGLVQSNYYRAKANQWAKEYEGSRSGSGGGNYYYNQITYLGEKYLNLAFGRYYQGRCTLEQLSDYVNVKARNIPNLEQVLLRKAPA